MGGAEPQASTSRIVGLDAWRVVLMFGGFLLHGSLWQPSQPLFSVIALVSHSFRMGTFFAISGHLCGLAMRKHHPRRWLARRTIQIGLPMLFGWSLLCPLIRLLARWYPATPVPLPFDWHHLWFLVALLAYAPLALLVERLDRRHGLCARWAASLAGQPSLLPLYLGIGAVSLGLMAGVAMTIGGLAPASLKPMLTQLCNIAGYLPEYLLGLAMARSPALALAVRRSWRAAVTVLAGTAMLLGVALETEPLIGGWWPQEIGNAATMVMAAICPPAVFALIFRSATGVRSVPPLLHRLCDASLTIYLLHLPLLLVANAVLAPLHLHAYGQFALAIALSAPLCYAIHAWVIRPSPLLSLVVNGRVDRWRRLAARAFPEGGESGGAEGGLLVALGERR